MIDSQEMKHGGVEVMNLCPSIDDLVAVIEQKPADVELILTGRGAAPRVIERADLVSEVKAVKHYYHKGVKARVGIEK